ncbi:mannosylglycerate hydrolase [Marinitoga hydrogenitolerans DSM 16785]|uniref:Mannosylglycerate hydrolase n=1 Tax=Marinitoga hydrogenitolerans (strain DSM 16785 / JCM 12826 / AT1271) TaxID=1122195 RepID=A0A1M4SKJ6_MARH1|nr:glycoside hydrolase family 38 C-terminal domain-containing protein [Marinitoga hydrogenitolerans]SHE32699.1 mannosylglycerate hydrolase [Marinitoga hydrogenitolerans DSM 16785]
MISTIYAHIISHTHWDREWFLNSEYTNEWLIPFLDSLFALLEKEKTYRFILDGQTLIIEDYLQQLAEKNMDVTSYKEKLKKYVQQKRLFIGPYYLQPDWQLTSGEALVRNLLIGHQISEEYGNVMKVGWLLDNFGQISQAVQIHKKFDIKGLFLWRGIEMEPTDINSEFLWESPDGSQILSVYLLSSYRNAMRLGEYKEIFKERIENEVKKIYPFATTPNVLLMNGYDQEMKPDNFFPVLRNTEFSNIKVKQSTPEEYIEEIKKYSPKLKVLKGALYSGRFISVFPGVLSSRMYLKLLNHRCQIELEKYTEPFSTINWLFTGMYEKEKIENSWKMLLKNHPHDSICGVSIDDVHIDMEKRFEQSYSLSKEVSMNSLKQIVSYIDTSLEEDPYIIFNNMPYKLQNKIITLKTDEKNFYILDSHNNYIPFQKGKDGKIFILLNEIPAMGYKTIYLKRKDKNSKIKYLNYDKVVTKKNIIENKYLKVILNSNGTLDLTDKINNYTYNNLCTVIDEADAGDEYNYSYPEKDVIITNNKNKAKIEFIEKGPLKVVVKISLSLLLPESLTEDRKTRTKILREMPIIHWVIVESNSPVIKIKTEIKNTVKDHRLRILFPTELNSKHSFAGSQFDIMKRSIKQKKFDDTLIPDNVKRIIIGARENKPITTFNQQYFVDINDGEKGISVLNKGLTEYEILPEKNTIALTLFRAVGWLARNDLLTRIGDAGPIIFTPDAQCLRKMEFEYAIYPHKGSHVDGMSYYKSLEFNIEPLIVKTDNHIGILKDENNFFELISENNSLQLSSLKIAEKNDGIIIRLFNTLDKKVSGKISTIFKIKNAYITNLYEDNIGKVEIISNNEISFKVEPKEIVTFKLDFDMKNIIKNKNMNSFYFKIINRDFELNIDKDFQLYESVPLILKEDIESEQKRMKIIEKKLEEAKKLAKKLENKLRNMKNSDKFIEIQYEYHKIKNEIMSYERAFLEAKISVILSQKKYLETYKRNTEDFLHLIKKIKSELRELGYLLNNARVNKRVYEYIYEYYYQKYKSSKNIGSKD